MSENIETKTRQGTDALPSQPVTLRQKIKDEGTQLVVNLCKHAQIVEGRIGDRRFLAAIRKLAQGRDVGTCWQEVASLGILNDGVGQIIAGWYGLHPLPDSRAASNLGSFLRSLAIARAKERKTNIDNVTWDRRFDRLVACGTREELTRVIQSIILFAKSQDVSVPYADIYADLRLYTSASRQFAHRNWIAGYTQRQSQIK